MGNLILGDREFTAPLKPITDYPTPLGEYLSAQSGTVLQSMRDRYSYIFGARPDNTIIGYRSADGPFPDEMAGAPIYGTDPSQQRIAAVDAQKQLDAGGVKLVAPTDGMYQDTIDSLVQRQQEKSARDVAISASPTGARSALGLGVQVATSTLDPLNIASAFVPVIGPMKYSAMLANASGALARFGIRAGVGAAEGALGTALVQPVDYLAARNVGDDYTMSTAMENIAFGAVFGAGLHSVSGAAHDLAFGAPVKPDLGIQTDVPAAPGAPNVVDAGGRQATASPVVHLETGDVPISPMSSAWMNNSISHETRIAATSTAVSQLLDGRNIEVSPIIRGDPNLQLQMAMRQQPSDMVDALAQARSDIEPQLRADLTAQAGNQAERGAVSQMQADLDRINAELAQPVAPSKDDVRALQSGQKLKYRDAAARAQAELDARRVDLRAQADRLRQSIDANRQASQASQDLAALNRGDFPDRYQDQLQARANQLLAGDPLTAAIRQLYTSSPAEDIASAQRFNAPENVAVADADMARAAGEQLAVIPDAMRAATTDGAAQAMDAAYSRLQGTLQDLQRRGASADLLQSLVREIEPYDALLKDSDNLAAAIRAAALCGISHG
ncbi:hypothetical protein [Burkholderia cenocepacia]|uniref:hypothetical protein n=1 Tax=Burkholderia cenocepacia TaxID=95486 RepID=UPI002ABDBD60|nr:hypothetical protein [Burkholderia cenocepacia]